MFGADIELVKNEIVYLVRYKLIKVISLKSLFLSQEFNHNYDCDKIQLTIEPDKQMQRINTKEIYTEIRRWFFQIKIAKEKVKTFYLFVCFGFV